MAQRDSILRNMCRDTTLLGTLNSLLVLDLDLDVRSRLKFKAKEVKVLAFSECFLFCLIQNMCATVELSPELFPRERLPSIYSSTNLCRISHAQNLNNYPVIPKKLRTKYMQMNAQRLSWTCADQVRLQSFLPRGLNQKILALHRRWFQKCWC